MVVYIVVTNGVIACFRNDSIGIAYSNALYILCGYGYIDYILTHRGRVTHICVSKLTIIGSDNGLSPDRRQTIIWTNAGILFIGPLGTKFSEILILIKIFSFKKMYLKMSSGKWRPSCLGLNVLTLLVLKPEYSGITRSIPWLLMPGLIVSPGHQLPWHWLWWTNGSLSSMRKDWSYLSHLMRCRDIRLWFLKTM